MTPDQRKEICGECFDRPAGCWKAALESCGCNHERKRREDAATTSGNCPIGKWTEFKHRTLIGVFSSPKYTARYDACNATWLEDARNAGQRYIVVSAGKTQETLPWRLWVDAPDTYEHLPQQVSAWIKWCLGQNGWDYLFKCDDDTYVSIPRFAEYDHPGADYIGARCITNGVTYGHGGAGYFLSRRAAEIVAQRMTAQDGGEDYHVGQTLAQAGIWLHLERRLNAGVGPSRYNMSITGHSKNQGDIWRMHRETGFNCLPPIPWKPETHIERSSRVRSQRGLARAR